MRCCALFSDVGIIALGVPIPKLGGNRNEELLRIHPFLALASRGIWQGVKTMPGLPLKANLTFAKLAIKLSCLLQPARLLSNFAANFAQESKGGVERRCMAMHVDCAMREGLE